MYIKQVDRKKCAAFLTEHYSFAYKDAVALVQSVADSAPGSRAVYDVITNEQYDNVFWSMAADNAGIKHNIKLGDLQKMEAEIISDPDFDELPEGFTLAIQDKIHEFCEYAQIDDMRKAPADVWGACCISIGRYIKQSKITIDKEKQKLYGGAPRDPAILSKLVDVWESFSNLYNKPPLLGDFCHFAGIELHYFESKTQKALALTSEDVTLRKKLLDILELGAQRRLMDGRVNPTGTIFLTKNLLGYQDNKQIEHITTVSAGSVTQLPRFNSTGLIETSEKP